MTDARRKLVDLLRLAYSGELAAALAYRGHAASVRDPVERDEIRRIEEQELDHRRRVGARLAELGARPSRRLELKARLIGRFLQGWCHVGGRFTPMYGAARLESGNIVEYVNAARLASEAGLEGMIDDLLEMAEVEWDHEAYFRGKASAHRLWRWFPHWTPPAPRETIRGTFRPASVRLES